MFSKEALSFFSSEKDIKTAVQKRISNLQFRKRNQNCSSENDIKTAVVAAVIAGFVETINGGAYLLTDNRKKISLYKRIATGLFT